MAAWIPITIVAALAQALRFLLQRHLRVTGLSSGGATFSRFVFSAPIVAMLILLYGAFGDRPLPAPRLEFWIYAIPGGLAQIAATMCVVTLFTLRSFAVGITLKKTETVQTAIVGLLVLGEGVSVLGAGAIGLGFLGVLSLSRTPGSDDRWFGRAAALGLASGVLFAVSATCYRGAALSLGDGDVILRAGLTLAAVTTFQSIALGLWLRWREPGQITKVAAAWRVAAGAGAFSLIGSFCWFTAFALQKAAYVKALGQVELIFSIMISTFLLGERIEGREYAGIALLTGSILLLLTAV